MHLLLLLVVLSFAYLPNHLFGDLRHGTVQLELQLFSGGLKDAKDRLDRRAIFLKTGKFRDHDCGVFRQTKMSRPTVS